MTWFKDIKVTSYKVSVTEKDEIHESLQEGLFDDKLKDEKLNKIASLSESLWIILDDFEERYFYKWIENNKGTLFDFIILNINDKTKIELLYWNTSPHYEFVSFVNEKGDKLFSPYCLKNFEASQEWQDRED